MSEIGLNSIMTSSGPSSTEKNPAKIRDAAKQFEALLIQEMLKSARASGSGDWSGTAEDPTGATMTDMADQQFAQLLASNGGMGLSKLVVDSLERKTQ